VGATYDATIADTNNLHRRVLIIGVFSVGAATVLGWLLAAFAVRPLKRLAEQTREIDAGDEAPDVEVRGATEAVEIADAVNGMLQAQSGKSRTAPRRRWRRPATSPRCRRTNCARR